MSEEEKLLNSDHSKLGLHHTHQSNQDMKAMIAHASSHCLSELLPGSMNEISSSTLVEDSIDEGIDPSPATTSTTSTSTTSTSPDTNPAQSQSSDASSSHFSGSKTPILEMYNSADQEKLKEIQDREKDIQKIVQEFRSSQRQDEEQAIYRNKSYLESLPGGEATESIAWYSRECLESIVNDENIPTYLAIGGALLGVGVMAFYSGK